jgi:hypothetical protein
LADVNKFSTPVVFGSLVELSGGVNEVASLSRHKFGLIGGISEVALLSPPKFGLIGGISEVAKLLRYLGTSLA